MKLTRKTFRNDLQNQKVSVRKLKNNSGISSSQKNRLARADLNHDGFISGSKETNRLFKEMDRYDRNGHSYSVNTRSRNVRSIHRAISHATVSGAVRSSRGSSGAHRNDGVRTSRPHHTGRATSTREIGNIAGIQNTSKAFREKVVQVANRLKMSPRHLMAVMSFESGQSFSPSKRNRVSGATGLIQFMPKTARRLGTSTRALARMSPERQLDYVEKYLKPYKGKMRTLEDAYMAVLWPAAVGKGPNKTLFRRGTKQYRQNRGLDINRDGRVTAREAASKVRAKMR